VVPLPDANLYVVALSGGRDSAAAGIWALEHVPRERLCFVFADTKAELPECYAYLDSYQARLLAPRDLALIRLASEGFAARLAKYKYFMPGPRQRWCTEDLKIKPLQAWRRSLGVSRLCWIVGGRIDERRLNRPDVVMASGNGDVRYYPGLDKQWTLARERQMLGEAGVGESQAYQIKPRSGCFNCFFQSRMAWRNLLERHPGLYALAEELERRAIAVSGQIGASPYTLLRGVTLEQLRQEAALQDYLPGLDPAEEEQVEIAEAFSSTCDHLGLCR